MLKLRLHFFKRTLVFQRIDSSYNVYFYYDPLIEEFLDNKVPVGILLDYIEENPHLVVIFYKMVTMEVIMKELRELYKDPTKLFEECM